MKTKDLLLIMLLAGSGALAWYFLTRKKSSASQSQNMPGSFIDSSLESKYTQPVYETAPADISSPREYMVA